MAIFYSQFSWAQNSVLVNFGSNSCAGNNAPSFSLINDPLGVSPTVLTSCDMSAQLPDFFSVFIAYNPKDNKIYIADVRTGVLSQIWLLDMGLPANLTCPAVIPVSPNYTHSNYVPNNFEFDNNGNLWSFRNYDPSTGQCSIDEFDVITGNVLSTKIVQFPITNAPTTLSSGDITILPNGRMFATFGAGPSRLYEILNYNSSIAGDASATYLQDIPLNTYGIAYLNGMLEITGADFGGTCYYYPYSISTNTLGDPQLFQNGQLPIDNTSITPAIGSTKRLLNSIKVNDNTADLTYEVFVQNMGNTLINNINATDDLEAVYGAGNISDVAISFVAGSNEGGLVLNNSYNGTTITNLLEPGQNLPNQTSANHDYFFKVQIKCRVTNLFVDKIYYNSAIGSGTLGNNLSMVSLSDSSNNGAFDQVDPNYNGNAGEDGENIPTPFRFLDLLPVNFITASAILINTKNAQINWTVATPVTNADKFEIEYSTNGTAWITAGKIAISSPTQSSYQFGHQDIPSGNIYYRIKQIDIDGKYVYSRVLLLKNNLSDLTYAVYPNPASDRIMVSVPYNNNSNKKILLELFNALGQSISKQYSLNSTTEIDTHKLANGTYWLKITNNGNVSSHKVVVLHN